MITDNVTNIIDAKSPTENIEDYLYQISGYALAINQKFNSDNPIKVHMNLFFNPVKIAKRGNSGYRYLSCIRGKKLNAIIAARDNIRNRLIGSKTLLFSLNITLIIGIKRALKNINDHCIRERPK